MKQAKWLFHELGLGSLRDTGLDAWLIILSRCNRMVAYGFNSLILALFFASLGFTDFQIGLFMTLTLLGDVLLSVLLTLAADKIGRRRICLVGSVLMVISGTTFAMFENYWILLFAAVVGVISATGGDCGPFRAIEESMLSELTTPKTRSDVLAWYVTMTTMSASIGTEVSGRVIHYLQGFDNWTEQQAYHAVFWVYTGMGLINIALTFMMSPNCELKKKPIIEAATQLEEAEGLLDGDSKPAPPPYQTPSTEKKGRFAQISSETRNIMYKLWFLLAVDCLADGMTPYSLMNYYVDLKFHLPKSTLGDITSASQFLCAIGAIGAGPLAKRIGLVNTMVFTHLPSSIAAGFIPLPSGVPMTVALLLFRAALNSMDQAPRSAFIAAVVKPEERTAVMGITSMLRTLAQSVGPTVTGILAGNDQFWIAFVATGALRVTYDLGLWALFINVKLHQHEQNDTVKNRPERRSSDEEEDMQEMKELEASKR
ncbi:MFS general substrate transporter [Tothia fuscella]|uniref:MFS general substrate transporter n=1 Tax=Tothia fuscella TaxID=1048955 RepID=A0A9P4NW42_9PEZI|nr:MFS general substrate transporter [Tothia fuscella]